MMQDNAVLFMTMQIFFPDKRLAIKIKFPATVDRSIMNKAPGRHTSTHPCSMRSCCRHINLHSDADCG